MDDFIEEIIADIDWRVEQLATLKTIPIIYNFQPVHKKQHLIFSIPSVYALWEGYVKNAFSIYIKKIKTLNIQRSEISLNLLTHTVDEICKLNNARLNFESKKRIVKELNNIFIDVIELSPNVPTGSNVNYSVIESLLSRFCIKEIDKSKYEKGLDKLLFFRNSIAHGDNALRVEEKDLFYFTAMVEGLMLDIVINIEDSYKNQSFKLI